MPVIDNLEYTLGLNTRDLERGGRRAESVLKRIDKAFGKLANINLAAEGVARFGRAVFGAGRQFIDAAVTMESLTRGLTAVAGSAKQAELQMADLREVAKLPGLGLEEALRGSINLQAAGLSAERATTSLQAFGNALATVGKGKADLQGVTLALTQIAAKGKLSAEEINQIAERVPQIRQVMKAAFGTAIPKEIEKSGISFEQFIDKVNEELLKLPQVTGGAQNAFENLGDTIFETRSRIGTRLLPTVVEFANKMGDAFDNLNTSLMSPNERMRELTSDMQDAQTEYDQTASKLEHLETQYDTLRERLEETEKGTDEHLVTSRELDGVITQLIKLVPELAAQYDNETKSLGNLNEALKRNQKLQQGILQGKFVEGIGEFVDEIDSLQTSLADAEQRFDLLNQAVKSNAKIVASQIHPLHGYATAFDLVAKNGEVLARNLSESERNSLTRGVNDLNQAFGITKGEIDGFRLSLQESRNVLGDYLKLIGPEAISTFNDLVFHQQKITTTTGEAKEEWQAFYTLLLDKAAPILDMSADKIDRMATVMATLAGQTTSATKAVKKLADVSKKEFKPLVQIGGGPTDPHAARAARLRAAEAADDDAIAAQGKADAKFIEGENAKTEAIGKRIERASELHSKEIERRFEKENQELEAQVKIRAELAKSEQDKEKRDTDAADKAAKKAAREKQDSIRKMAQGYADVSGAVLSVAEIVGVDLGEDMKTAVGLADDFAGAFISLAAGDVLGAVASGVSGVAGVLGLLFGESESDRRKRALRQEIVGIRDEIAILMNQLNRMPEEFEGGKDALTKLEEGLRQQLALVQGVAGDTFGEILDTIAQSIRVNQGWDDIKESVEQSMMGAVFQGVLEAQLQKEELQSKVERFVATLNSAISDGVIDADEKRQIDMRQGSVRAASMMVQKRTRDILQASGMFDFDSVLAEAETDAAGGTGRTTPAGMSVAIRQITSRQADELALVFAGVQSTNREIANNTLRTADTLELYLPTLAERIDMMDHGLSPGGSGSRGEARQLTETKRSQGNLNG